MSIRSVHDGPLCLRRREGPTEGELPPLQGVLDRPAFRLEADSLCAIVSECPLSNVRAERKHIAATQRVLAALNANFDLLPMTFGTVTKSEDDLRRFLNDNQETLSSQLQRVSGAVEMALRLSLDVPDPIAYLVERTPALKAARDRTFRAPPQAVLRRQDPARPAVRRGVHAISRSRSPRQVLTADRQTPAPNSSSLPVRDEKQIANLAILVPRAGLERFEAAVSAAAAQIDDDIVFNLSGPGRRTISCSSIRASPEPHSA